MMDVIQLHAAAASMEAEAKCCASHDPTNPALANVVRHAVATRKAIEATIAKTAIAAGAGGVKYGCAENVQTMRHP